MERQTVRNEFDAPAPGRFCRQHILAFLVLNLLGSCVHIPPAAPVKEGVKTSANLVSAPAQTSTTTP
jgi:hypothetical protein